MSDTVITPEALARSKSLRPTKAKDLPSVGWDEAFYFLFPSPNVFDQENGDGQLLEILDWSKDYSRCYTNRREFELKPDDLVYLRG